MKKILTILAIMMVAITSWAENTYDEPSAVTTDGKTIYQIGTVSNLLWFMTEASNATAVNMKAYNAQLTADIIVNANVLKADGTLNGTPATAWIMPGRFYGTFDGQGHIISGIYCKGSSNIGLFGINSGTICNLGIVDSYFETTDENSYVGTFASSSSSGGTITDCYSLATISGKSSCGGIVAINGGTDASSAFISNCYYAGTMIGCANNYSGPITEDYKGYYGTVTNCYYLSTSKLDNQAVQRSTSATAAQMSSGEIALRLNNSKTSDQAWFQAIGTDKLPVLLSTGSNTVYYGYANCEATEQTYNNSAALTETGHEYGDNGVCEKTPGEIHCLPATYDEASQTYLISKTSDLIWFATQVKAGSTGINGKLTADVSLGSYQAMIGTEAYPYAGSFDGDGHTVTVAYNSLENYTALFRYVDGATITNLRTDGSITTSAMYAAGFVGSCLNSTISRCVSTVNITATYSYVADHGGIVGNVRSEGCAVSDCIYNGTFNCENTPGCGGIVGWAGYALTISNCACVVGGTVSSTNACTIARGNSVTINNCYYTTALGAEQQGTNVIATDITDGTLVLYLGPTVWIQDATLNMPLPFRQVSSAADMFNKYLKFTAATDGTIQINQTGTVSATLQYGTDDSRGWQDVTYDTPISISAGKSMWLRAKGKNGKNATLNGSDNYLTFSSTCDFAASQNTMSLLDASCSQSTLPAYAFYRLFYKCTHLTQAPELPLTKLDKKPSEGAEYCYARMFEGCTSLKVAPALPAKDISYVDLCYAYMFKDCTSLTSIPDLRDVQIAPPAGIASDFFQFYCEMFKGCSSLKINTVGPGTEWGISANVPDDSHYDWHMLTDTGGNFEGLTSQEVDEYQLAIFDAINLTTVYEGGPLPGVTYYVYNGEHYTREMTNQWGTICLPFAAENGSDYDLYTLTGATEDAITLTKVVGILPAGTPALVRRNAAATGIDIAPANDDKFLRSPVTGSSAGGLTLTGAFTSTDITDKDGYIIANNAFWNIADIKGENKVYCSPFRAYLAGTLSSDAKMLTIGFDDDTPTAVVTINAITTGTAEYYDINGRKLSGLQQGVNIIKMSDGTTKKVIIK